MPYKARRICIEPNCNDFAESGSSRCKTHKQAQTRAINQNRDVTDKRFRSTKYWLISKKVFIHNNPLCKECGGRATDVDHVNGYTTWSEFADQSNWQSLCKSCHSTKTANEMKERKVW